eukprot:scaffold3359_cov123-Cylindrotheca_fusiformis.AAC.2
MTITWVIMKKEPKGKIGVVFRSKRKLVTIEEVTGRAKKKTDLVSGLKVLKVCGQDVSTATQATQLVAEAPVGEIRIVTEGMHHTATKMTSKEKAGFAVQPSIAMKGFVEISKVNPLGMFPDITAGHILWSINGRRIKNVPQAISIMQHKKTLKLVCLNLNKKSSYFRIRRAESFKDLFSREIARELSSVSCNQRGVEQEQG